LFLLFLVYLSIETYGWNHVITPFGMVPDSCVHQLPQGAILRETDTTVEVLHRNGTVEVFPAQPECLKARSIIHHSRLEKRKALSAPAKGRAWASGWLDYSCWFTPSNVNTFTGDYLVPGNPPQDASQVLFYFIGAENMVSGENVSILQPVLTWGNGINGWSIASWNCCPQGQTWHSNPLTGFAAGDTLYGEIAVQSDGNWDIVSKYGSQATTLTVAPIGREFNWVDVTLEIYTLDSCGQFAVGPTVFSNLALTLDDGSSPTPDWKFTGPTECSGSITAQNAFHIEIQHSNS